MTAGTETSRPPGQYYCPSCERMYPEGAHCPEDGTRLVRIKAVVDPLLGRNLDDRYTILEKLGQGGMGAVYRGEQHSVGREVAIKVVSPHLVTEPDVIKRFLREAKLASRLTHPNAVAVLDFGQTEDGLFYLVMELVVGRTLAQVIEAERVLRPERVIRIGVQVCDALEGAHALQIVHRDLKPANIMVLAHGRDLIKVLDFGLAKSVAPDQTATTMTNAGSLLGTPAFIPPELALGERCDGRADLYSLGVMLYLMGSGRLPFVSDSVHELIALHGHEPAPPMTGVPPGLAAVVDRLLQKDPAQRYQTAAEAREALEASLGPRNPWHMDTPAPETRPSIGPFPMTSEQLGLDTPLPRSTTEMQRLVSSDTIAMSAGESSSTSRPARRWLALVIAVAALLAIGGGVLLASSRGNDADPGAEASGEPPHAEPPSEAPSAPPTVENAVAPAPAPVVEPPAPPAVSPTPPPSEATAEDMSTPAAPDPTTKKASAKSAKSTKSSETASEKASAKASATSEKPSAPKASGAKRPAKDAKAGSSKHTEPPKKPAGSSSGTPTQQLPF